MNKPYLIATLGFPGSGKSYFSERLSKEKGFVHLNSDRTRHTLFKQPSFSKSESAGVFRLMDYFAREFLLRGISVIYDANLNTLNARKRLQRLAQECNAIYQLIWIQTDLPIAEKRLETRGLGKNKNLIYPPLKKEILHLLKSTLDKPKITEPHIIIDGHLPFDKQLDEFLNKLK